MPDASQQLSACLTELQGSTHAALMQAVQGSSRPQGKAHAVVSFTFLLFLLFGLGVSFSFLQHGEQLSVFARQAPGDFDRNAMHHRRAVQQVEERERRRLMPAAPQEEPVIETPSPAVPPPATDTITVPASPPEEAPVLPAPPDTTIPVPAEETVPPAREEQPPAEPVLPEQPVPEEVPPVEAPPPEPSLPVSPRSPTEIGVFFTQTSVKNETYFLETLDRLKSLTGSALIFNVKAGTVHFAAAAPMAEELDLIVPFYDLPTVIAQAHERGVTTIGRFVALKDPNLAQMLPETQIRHPKTDRSVGNVWVDPGNEEVIVYNEQILRDLVAAGIDEINLDYIRYPTEYAQTSVGLKGSEKADRLETFLKMARRVIDEHGGKTKLGISTYAILGWNFPVNFEPLGQDIARFAPLVDVISPMAYPSTFAQGAYYNPAKHPRSRMYYLVYRTLTGYRDLLGDQAWKLRPWIQGYGITQKNLKDEIDAVFDAGSCGFTIWNASNEYRIFMQMLPDVKRPERCVVH